MKRRFFVVVLLCSMVLLTSCLYIADSEPGTVVYYYVKNESSRDVYFVLEGDRFSVQPTEGTVKSGETRYLGKTEQIEVAGHGFESIWVYDNVERTLLLIEADADPFLGDAWDVVKGDSVLRTYWQTLVIEDDGMIKIDYLD